MECTTAHSLASMRSNALATALALGLGVSVGVTAAPDAVQPLRQFGRDGGDARAQMRNWLADHPELRTQDRQRGATLPVTSCADDDSAGTLRAVVAAAPESATVDMSELSCSVITLDSPVFIPQDNLELLDNGSTVITADPTNLLGLLIHHGAGVLDLTNLHLYKGLYELTSAFPATGACVWSGQGSVFLTSTIVEDCEAVNHDGDAYGGAVYASDVVSVVNSVVTGSKAIAGPSGYAHGGGVAVRGVLSMIASTVVDNIASSAHGAEFSAGGGAWVESIAIIYDSTIANNSAGKGGGLMVARDEGAGGDGSVIQSSTISGNHATTSIGSGAGVVLYGRESTMIHIMDSTITANVNEHNNATAGLYIGIAGLVAAGSEPSIILKNNLISGNVGENTFDYDFGIFPGVTVSGDHNLVGYVDPAAGGSAVPIDTIHDSFTPLGPLQDNGGPTPTHAIGTGSWAFNLGQSTSGDDQRRMPRSVGAGVDIGAFESDALFIGRFEDPPRSL